MLSPLQAKRKQMGFAQNEFADCVGIPVRTYRRYETLASSRGYRIPDAVKAIKIADTLGTTVEELWGDSTPK